MGDCNHGAEMRKLGAGNVTTWNKFVYKNNNNNKSKTKQNRSRVLMKPRDVGDQGNSLFLLRLTSIALHVILF